MVDLIKIINDYYEVADEVETINLSDKYWFRASKFYYMCPMEEAICYHEKIKRYDILDGKTNMLFQTGHDFHYKIQKALADKGVLLGNWRCSSCGLFISDIVPMPSVCPTCNKSGVEVMEYVEVVLFIEKLRVGGHCDGILPDNSILEIKTTNERSFNNFIWNGIPDSYKCQANIYMSCYNTDTVLFLPIHKNDEDMRIFEYHYDEKIFKGIVEKAIVAVNGILEGHNSIDKYKVARVCDSASCSRAKSCKAASICFRKK